MADFLATKVGRGLFEKHISNYQPVDPLYEEYVDKKGRTRRRKRELPPGLSKRDAKILQKIKWRAHYLDKGFRVCGMRFGWTFVIGLIPIVGDVADASINYVFVVRKAKQAEIPEWLWRRMLINNAVSAAVGFVPIVGDIALATFKANSRNAALLEEFLRIRGEEAMKSTSARVQNPVDVRPGAGLEAGEHLDPGGSAHGGKKPSIMGSIMGRKSKEVPVRETPLKGDTKVFDPQALVESAKTMEAPAGKPI